jgi:NAD-dependent deacetylase
MDGRADRVKRVQIVLSNPCDPDWRSRLGVVRLLNLAARPKVVWRRIEDDRRRMDPIRQLADLLAGARSAVAFTGAGISTESGIPDFRSPGGVWSRHRPIEYDEFVSSRSARVSFWKERMEMYRDFAGARPNDGHRALADLEQRGRLDAVITQNIDGLHQLAGSRRVIELHGTARMVACIQCGKEWSPEEVHRRIEGGDEAPDCDECGAPLKSKTVSFGQAMPPGPLAESDRLARQTELLLAIGSSLVVEPAASIPRVAKNHGATLVILNATETPLDCLADVLLHLPIGETMRRAAELVP